MESTQRLRYKPEDFVNAHLDRTHFFIIDLSWHAYRGYYTHRSLSIEIGNLEVPSGHVMRL